MIIKFDFTKAVKSSLVSKAIQKATLGAATAAMCVNLGLTAEETEAAKAALRDIANECGAAKARAIVTDMKNHPDDPFDGPFIA